MIRKILVAATAVAAIAAYAAVTQPVEAGSCAVLSAKSPGLKEAATSGRSQKKLAAQINHWAHKQGLKAVRVGTVSTACKKATALVMCTSSAKVCP